MNKKLIFHNQNGQALMETLIVFPIFAALLIMIGFTCDILLTKQQLLMAARYGTDLIYYTGLNEEQVKFEVMDYLCGDEVKGRKINIPKEQIDVRIDRFPVIRGISLDKFKDVVDSYTKPLDHTSYVEITYKRPVPNIVKVLNIFARVTGTLPKDISISSRSEVLAGTGA